MIIAYGPGSSVPTLPAIGIGPFVNGVEDAGGGLLAGSGRSRPRSTPLAPDSQTTAATTAAASSPTAAVRTLSRRCARRSSVESSWSRLGCRCSVLAGQPGPQSGLNRHRRTPPPAVRPAGPPTVRGPGADVASPSRSTPRGGSGPHRPAGPRGRTTTRRPAAGPGALRSPSRDRHQGGGPRQWAPPVMRTRTAAGLAAPAGWLTESQPCAPTPPDGQCG